MISLTDIKNKRGTNPGGSVNVYLCPWHDIQSIGLRNASGQVSAIACKEGKRFYHYEFLPAKAKLRSKTTGSGQYFEQSLELTISGDEPEKLQEFEQMIGGLFIAIVEQASGSRKLMGGMLCPLKCTEVGYDAGGDTGDLNGTSLKFEARGGMATEFTGIIPLEVAAAPLVLSLQASQLSAAGAADGGITSTVSGGVAPYSYAWADGPTTANRSNLAAGTYTLTVTDADGTQQTASATIAIITRATAWRAKDSTMYCITD